MARLGNSVVSNTGNVVNLLLSVEDGRRLFQSLAFGLDEEKEDVDKFERQERKVYGIL